ncbi:hypothetical protein W97_03924 [Coniosporium apollinis CBS 100218]|uniref:Uncharacterized protein n=1 Tax=Coniosporium apollinis (strain CBS 100218) TaxID=1168221 RepID=R7YSS5_CONA1|nr:uncharacterized protein W97_03924 [Coniosporium apollinis CBS 100218]EON64691.1 hypothetical protein W97_03924 [Coniosporium apollinis CBS 100218]
MIMIMITTGLDDTRIRHAALTFCPPLSDTAPTWNQLDVSAEVSSTIKSTAAAVLHSLLGIPRHQPSQRLVRLVTVFEQAQLRLCTLAM